MHAFYCRLLHLHHAHDDAGDAAPPAQEPTPLAEPAAPNRAASPSTPPSQPRQRAGADRDHRASLHTLVVPRLIDSGYTLDQISEMTGMPRALVDLIADEHGPADVAAAAAATALREVRHAQRRQAEQARRRRTRTLAIIVLAAVLDIVVSLASVILRHLALGVISTLGSFLLVLAVVLLARRGTRNTPDRSDPPQ